MADSIALTISNYDKFKGRKDVGNPSWFKLSNDFLADPDFYNFTFAEKCVWIWFLSVASKKQSATIEVGFAHAKRAADLDKEVLLSALNKLEAIGCVTSTSRPRNARVTSTLPRREEKREEEKREEQPPTATPSARDLFNLWNDKRGALSLATELSEARQKKAKAQLARYDLAHFAQVIERWQKSDFCMTQWRPTFDDLLNETKRTSTLEGKYDNRPTKGFNPPSNAPIRPLPVNGVKVDLVAQAPQDDSPMTYTPELVRSMLGRVKRISGPKEGAS